jgi:hypothetical protein
MWSKMPQRAIGTTTSGKAIGFHYSEGGDGAQKFNHFDHYDAAHFHDRKRNNAAMMASHFENQKLHGAANGYRKLAAHHAEQSKKHMAHVLPASTKQPVTKPGNQTKATSRKEAAQPRKPAKQTMTVGMQNKMKKYAPVF